MLPGSKENGFLLFPYLLTAAKSLIRTGAENKHPSRTTAPPASKCRSVCYRQCHEEFLAAVVAAKPVTSNISDLEDSMKVRCHSQQQR